VGLTCSTSAAVYISPYDAQKRVWIVDDHHPPRDLTSSRNDGKQLLQPSAGPTRRRDGQRISTADVSCVFARPASFYVPTATTARGWRS